MHFSVPLLLDHFSHRRIDFLSHSTLSVGHLCSLSQTPPVNSECLHQAISFLLSSSLPRPFLTEAVQASFSSHLAHLPSNNIHNPMQST